MNYTQGEVIDINGLKLVYIAMKRTKYTAIDLKDPTRSYSCKGGKSTGEFRPDIVQEYFKNEGLKAVKQATKDAESFKYKALAVGQKISMGDGKDRFVMKHKRTKLLSMDRNGDIWDSHYGAIKGLLDGTIYDESETLRNEFTAKKAFN